MHDCHTHHVHIKGHGINSILHGCECTRQEVGKIEVGYIGPACQCVMIQDYMKPTPYPPYAAFEEEIESS